jgi:hypothetical protein
MAGFLHKAANIAFPILFIVVWKFCEKNNLASGEKKRKAPASFEKIRQSNSFYWGSYGEKMLRRKKQ